MFISKPRLYSLVNSKYIVSESNELLNDTCGGGGRLFISKTDRHVYIDISSQSNECYSVSMYLDAIKFKPASYNLECMGDISLFYLPKKEDRYADYTEEDILRYEFFVNLQNNLILIGDIYADGSCYQFFKDTYCVINNGNINLLIIMVNKDILRRIKINNTI